MKAKQKIQGYIWLIAGFVLIVTNALTYLLDKGSFTSIGIIGLAFVVIGIGIIKKANKA